MTPDLPNGGGKTRGGKRKAELLLDGQAAFWPTADANVFQDGMDCTREEWEARRQRLKDAKPGANGNGCGTPLAMEAQLWATPRIGGGTENPETQAARHALLPAAVRPGPNTAGLEQQVSLWASPRATDGEKGGPNMSFGAGGTPLPTMASDFPASSESPWAIPTTQDAENVAGASQQQRNSQPLNAQALLWVSPLVADAGQKVTLASNQVALLKQAHAFPCSLPVPDAGNTSPTPAIPDAGLPFLLTVTLPSGARCLSIDPTRRRRLSVTFACNLMGWPEGWTTGRVASTSFERWAMACALWLRRSPSAFSGRGRLRTTNTEEPAA